MDTPQIDPGVQDPVTLEYNKEQVACNKLISSFQQEEKKKIESRRKLRENKKNVDEERQRGTILNDETIIPDRTIDQNIRRSSPGYLAYIMQAKRFLSITDVDDPDRALDELELWFARGMRYPGWKSPWVKLIDSMHVHGGCALEVIFDNSKPFNCTIEYVPREHLIFPTKTKDIQTVPRILRQYDISSIQLEEFANSFGFDESVVADIKEKYTEKNELITIYRILTKINGLVYNYWYSELARSTYLREPQLHQIGLFDFDPAQIQTLCTLPNWDMIKQEFAKPKPLKAYPIVWFKYQETENEVLLEEQGRVALDLHVQEAMTHLLTNTVNATTRASNFYPSAENAPGDDAKLMELGPLKHGIVMSRKIDVWQAPWPNDIILSVIQALSLGKAQEAGDSDFAAMARKDANKTATEMTLAVQQSQQQSSNAITSVFSPPFLEIYGICFLVASHQAIFGLCQQPKPLDLIFGRFNLEASGDIEVIKRQEDLNNARQFFDIIRGTPLAEKLLEFLMQHFFPDQADEWLPLLQSPDKDAMIQQLAQVLSQVPTDELNPEQRTQLQSLIASAQAMVGPSNNKNVPSAPGSSPQPNPPGGNAMSQSNPGR